MFEAMMRQYALGIISPEMQGLCQIAKDHPASATIAVDYGAPALGQLKSKFGEVSTTICEIMVEAGIWGKPPEKLQASTCPALHGTGDMVSTDFSDLGLPMPV